MSTMIVEVYEALKAAGAPEDKAQAAASVLAESLPARADLSALATKASLDNLSARVDRTATKADIDVLTAKVDATKADLDALSARVDLMASKSELREVELRIEAKLEALKADLLKWVIGAIGFQTLVILGAFVSFAKVSAR